MVGCSGSRGIPRRNIARRWPAGFLFVWHSGTQRAGYRHEPGRWEAKGKSALPRLLDVGRKIVPPEGITTMSRTTRCSVSNRPLARTAFDRQSHCRRGRHSDRISYRRVADVNRTRIQTLKPTLPLAWMAPALYLAEVHAPERPPASAAISLPLGWHPKRLTKVPRMSRRKRAMAMRAPSPSASPAHRRKRYPPFCLVAVRAAPTI